MQYLREKEWIDAVVFAYDLEGSFRDAALWSAKAGVTENVEAIRKYALNLVSVDVSK